MAINASTYMSHGDNFKTSEIQEAWNQRRKRMEVLREQRERTLERERERELEDMKMKETLRQKKEEKQKEEREYQERRNAFREQQAIWGKMMDARLKELKEMERKSDRELAEFALKLGR